MALAIQPMSNSPTPFEIEIFKPGTFTSVEGTEVSFGAADLEEMVGSYDPTSNPAPMVVGHPALDAPAYGWAGGLRINDAGRLVAVGDQVEASFAEMVNDGRFKKVSAKFYPRDHPANPTPGKFHLKHIGFLGAAAPAVKGLKSVSFADGVQAGCITFEIDNSHPTHEPKEPIVAEKDKELSFAERETALAAREDALAKSEAKAKDDRIAIDKAAADARHAGHVSFAESQIAVGRLAPAAKDEAVFLMDALSSAPQTLSFGEGDKSATPVALFQRLVSSAKPLISFGEVAKAEPKVEAQTPHQVGMKARKLVSDAGGELSYSEAVAQVKAGAAI